MKYTADDILNIIKSQQWLFKNIFWDILDYLIRDQKLENEKRLLKQLGYKDVEKVFDIKFNYKEFKEVSRIVFRIMWQDEEKKTSFLSSNKENQKNE